MQHLSCKTFCNCHGGQNCLNPFTATRENAQSAEGETENDYIHSNLPDDSDDGLDKSMRIEAFLMTKLWTIWMSGNKGKETKQTLYYTILCLFCRSFSLIHLSVRLFLNF